MRPIRVAQFEWGANTKSLLFSQDNDYKAEEVKADGVRESDVKLLLLGAELLYCVEVVTPLFNTIGELLSNSSSRGVFILATSFDVGKVEPALIL